MTWRPDSGGSTYMWLGECYVRGDGTSGTLESPSGAPFRLPAGFYGDNRPVMLEVHIVLQSGGSNVNAYQLDLGAPGANLPWPTAGVMADIIALGSSVVTVRGSSVSFMGPQDQQLTITAQTADPADAVLAQVVVFATPGTVQPYPTPAEVPLPVLQLELQPDVAAADLELVPSADVTAFLAECTGPPVYAYAPAVVAPADPTLESYSSTPIATDCVVRLTYPAGGYGTVELYRWCGPDPAVGGLVWAQAVAGVDPIAWVSSGWHVVGFAIP